MRIIQSFILNRNFLLFLIFLAFSVYIYSRYFSNLNFGDEYDNFAYSWLVSQGYIPYKDFFTHHFPFLIFLGLPAEKLGHTLVLYRETVLFFTFSFFSFLFFYLKGIWRASIIPFMLFSSFSIAFYSGFQFVDGSFWAILILTAFFIILKKGGEELNKQESIFLGILTLAMLFSSPMHLLAFAMLFIYFAYVSLKNADKKEKKRRFINLKLTLITIVLGLILFIVYLLKTSSFIDFYRSTIDFNNTYFYYRDQQQIISPKIIDFYLHSTLNLIHHVRGLISLEGAALVTFIRSLMSYINFGQIDSYKDYTKIIFIDFYNNFFSFEMMIMLFYLFGIVSLFLNKYKSLAFFCIVFVFGIRIRVPERIHEAPYYLFSYWLLSIAVVLCLNNIFKKKLLVLNTLGLSALILLVCIFIRKNWYDFNQIAFNRFPEETAISLFLNRFPKGNDRTLIIADGSSKYYWKSKELPYGYFVNYFPWYDWDPRLNKIWLDDISDFDGKAVIVEGILWENYKNDKSNGFWLSNSLKKLDTNFKFKEEGNFLVFTKN